MTFRSIHVSMEVSAGEVIMFDETQNSHVPCEVWMDVAVPFGAQQKCSKLLGGGRLSLGGKSVEIFFYFPQFPAVLP